MTYHPLASESGGDDFARNREAAKIIFDLKLIDKTPEMNAKQREFVESSAARLRQYGVKTIFTTPQIFWLRDLSERFL
jgi:hypothetical protein